MKHVLKKNNLKLELVNRLIFNKEYNFANFTSNYILIKGKDTKKLKLIKITIKII